MLLFTEFSEMSNHLILISISPEVKSKYPIEMGQKNMYNYIIGTNIIYGGAAMDIEKTMKNLKSRGFGAQYADAKGFGEFMAKEEKSKGEVMKAVGIAK